MDCLDARPQWVAVLSCCEPGGKENTKTDTDGMLSGFTSTSSVMDQHLVNGEVKP